MCIFSSSQCNGFIVIILAQCVLLTYLSSSCRVAHKVRTRPRQTPLSWALLAAVPMSTQQPSLLLPLFDTTLFSVCQFFCFLRASRLALFLLAGRCSSYRHDQGMSTFSFIWMRQMCCCCCCCCWQVVVHPIDMTKLCPPSLLSG